MNFSRLSWPYAIDPFGPFWQQERKVGVRKQQNAATTGPKRPGNKPEEIKREIREQRRHRTCAFVWVHKNFFLRFGVFVSAVIKITTESLKNNRPSLS